jgi:hypothetical protein
MELGMAVVELAKPAVSPDRFVGLEVRRELRFEALAQPGEELDRCHWGRAYQRLRIYLVK